MQAAAEENVSQVELFLNSVPLLSSLTYEQKMDLVHAFTEEAYAGLCIGHPLLERKETEGVA